MKLLPLHPRIARGSTTAELMYAQVDDEDFDELMQYTWYYKVDNANDPHRRHISIGRPSKKGDEEHLDTSHVLLNRHILHIDDPDILVYCYDGDKLNCQKGNLYVKLNGHKVMQLRLHWLEQTKVDVQLKMELPR